MRGILIILSLIVIVPTASANCLSYGFFNDENINHRSFLMTEGYHFGNELFVETNCEIEIIVNDIVIETTNSTAVLRIPNGIHDIQFLGENYSKSYSSVYVQGGTFLESSVFANTTLISEQSVQLSLDDFNTGKIFVALGNSAILFVLITVVYWNLINRYIDRSYFEEVIS